MWQALVGIAGVLGAVAAWKLWSQARVAASGLATSGPRVTTPWMVVEAWRADTLVLRTRAQPGLPLTLPLEPLRTGVTKANDETLRILDTGELAPVVAKGATGEGLAWSEVEPGLFEVQLDEVRVRVTSLAERPVIDRVAPLPTPKLYAVPEPCPGEPNPFPQLHAQWLEAHPDFAQDEAGEPLFPLTTSPLAPVHHGQNEADLFADAAAESVLGSLDDGLPGIGDLDEEDLIGLGNDGTGDGLVGAVTPQGSLATYWIGHDPPGIFFRGPSLILLLQRLLQERGVEEAVSAWGVLDEQGSAAIAVPPCYLSGSENLETKLDAQPQSRLVLDFRGKPAGHAYESMEAFPVGIIEGLVMVLQE